MAWPEASDPLVPLHSDFDRLVVLSEDVKALKQNRILPPDCRKQPVKTSVQRYYCLAGDRSLAEMHTGPLDPVRDSVGGEPVLRMLQTCDHMRHNEDAPTWQG